MARNLVLEGGESTRLTVSQERFARKNEAEDLRRAFDILDIKRRAEGSATLSRAPTQCAFPQTASDLLPSDGRIDADEVEEVFKRLGHKCKRVRLQSCVPLLR